MKIKKLEWVKRDMWIADTPASHRGYITISFEEGKYWPNWACSLPGSDDLETVMAQGQEFHDTFIKKFIED